MVINSRAVRWFRAVAVTVCPFIFIAQDLSKSDRSTTLLHEWVHWWQQFVFGVIGALVGIGLWLMLSWPPQPETALVLGLGAIEGWVAGQLLWRWLYLVGIPFGLPFWWNYWRRRWETAAYRAQEFGDDEIKRILREPPYYLR